MSFKEATTRMLAPFDAKIATPWSKRLAQIPIVRSLTRNNNVFDVTYSDEQVRNTLVFRNIGGQSDPMVLRNLGIHLGYEVFGKKRDIPTKPIEAKGRRVLGLNPTT